MFFSPIFIKHMSEHYKVRKDELIGLVNKSKSSYYTKKEIDDFHRNDRDKFVY